MVYGKDANDISIEVTKALNKAYKNKDSKTDASESKDEPASEE